MFYNKFMKEWKMQDLLNFIDTKNMNQLVETKKFRVRYGRDNRGQRNSVLVTTQVDNTIYFGVSKCCERDRFNKEFGCKVALGRLKKTLINDLNDPYEKLDNFNYFDKMNGCVDVSNVKLLLVWFDEFAPRQTHAQFEYKLNQFFKSLTSEEVAQAMTSKVVQIVREFLVD